MAQPLHFLQRFLLTLRDCLAHLGEGEGISEMTGV